MSKSALVNDLVSFSGGASDASATATAIDENVDPQQANNKSVIPDKVKIVDSTPVSSTASINRRKKIYGNFLDGFVFVCLKKLIV